MKYIKYIVFMAVSLSLLVTGCGFQMRGDWQLPASVQNTVMSGGTQQLYTHLQREFRAASASLTRPPAESSAASIVILQDTMERRVLSVDNRGKAIEYQIIYLFRFKVLGADGKVLVKEQQINIARDYPFVATEVGGAFNQELSLRDDLRKDMARQIMRRIQAQAS